MGFAAFVCEEDWTGGEIPSELDWIQLPPLRRGIVTWDPVNEVVRTAPGSGTLVSSRTPDWNEDPEDYCLSS